MTGGWFDQEAIEAERLDADIQQAELERLRRELEQARREVERLNEVIDAAADDLQKLEANANKMATTDIECECGDIAGMLHRSATVVRPTDAAAKDVADNYREQVREAKARLSDVKPAAPRQPEERE